MGNKTEEGGGCGLFSFKVLSLCTARGNHKKYITEVADELFVEILDHNPENYRWHCLIKNDGEFTKATFLGHCILLLLLLSTTYD